MGHHGPGMTHHVGVGADDLDVVTRAAQCIDQSGVETGLELEAGGRIAPGSTQQPARRSDSSLQRQLLGAESINVGVLAGRRLVLQQHWRVLVVHT